MCTIVTKVADIIADDESSYKCVLNYFFIELS